MFFAGGHAHFSKLKCCNTLCLQRT